MVGEYLKQIGIKEGETPSTWNKGDQREEQWAKCREIYGFDERDTWDLHYTIKLFLYERLKMFNDVNCIETNNPYQRFTYKEKELSLQDCIDMMLEGLKLDLTLDEYDKKREDKGIQEKIDCVFVLLAQCINYLWW